MSNPAVLTLFSGKINNRQTITIEDNFGESIHIHIGELTFYLTLSEFENLVESFMEAGRKLFAERGISLDEIDISAFDWTWLKRYKHISSIRDTDISINDLYTINKSIYEGQTVWHYVKINESKNYKALMGDKGVLSQYNEFNLYGQNSESRLNDLLNHMANVGYPFDDKYIIINQYGVIYDGAHRAAILAYLNGFDAKIPVKEIVFDDDVPVEEYNRRVVPKNKRRLVELLKVRARPILRFLFKKRYSGGKDNLSIKVKKTQKPKSETVTFDDFLKIVESTQINHYYINKVKTDKNDQKISDITLVVEKSQYNNFKQQLEKYFLFGEEVDCYKNYKMLYSLDRPFVYHLNELSVLVCGQIFVKSLFFDALLPIDKFIIDQAKALVESGEPLFVSEDIILIMTIMDAVFEKGYFAENDKHYLINNKDILKREIVKEMLNHEFYKFTDELISLILNEEFEEVVPNYFKFKEY